MPKKKPVKTLTIDLNKALSLFTDWHVDEVTDRSEARNYGKRLITRLKKEAKAD
jgi:hypothetical protein